MRRIGIVGFQHFNATWETPLAIPHRQLWAIAEKKTIRPTAPAGTSPL
jgi:hypothetical protein